MGQRHQIFVIAKIGKAWRSFGCVHLQFAWSVEWEEGIKVVKEFEAYGMIDTATLSATWPGIWRDEGHTGSRDDQDDSEYIYISNNSDTTLQLQQVIEEAFSTSTTQLPDLLKSVEDKSQFWRALIAQVYSTPTLVERSLTASTLLRTAFRNKRTVDLSPFSLNEEQIFEILCRGTKKTRIHTLSLSGNQKLNEKLLEDILSRHQSLEVVHLLNTPQIRLETKLSVFRDHNKTTSTYFLDTELLAEPFLTGPGFGLPQKHFPLSYFNKNINQMVILASNPRARLERLPCGGLSLD
ncbi:uncharacterized protein LY89DRAFT_724201 [Mollisia scopiformis]|uniref:Uncharacterized protein n=1 Tax=Mollisia scopiformis TaxID=149040 RepID=A0A132BBL0_MOLSC|nr:uncharacterized protein LY89DRAFT_724201 [Mollisia scopiformis]KUJ09812.1 hypothetical protein LY89DRAFT_724201 [Mollisia scopiformis]